MTKEAGIIGYGAYIPIYRVKACEIGKIWGNYNGHVPITEKAVAGIDEDLVTISVEAAKYAIRRAKINPKEIGAVYIGTESKPYAVKPSGTIVAEAIGATPLVVTADFEFACKAGTEAFQACIDHVLSGRIKYAMAIGADTAQGRPGDQLEYTAASGGAAFIFTKKSNKTLAYCEGAVSFVTDTPDFWRRAYEHYPMHAERFTGEPAYFYHIINSVRTLMENMGLKPSDFKYAVFHQPNAKFPVKVAKKLGFTMEQIKPGLLSPYIGNCYAGSSLVGFAATLDVANPGDRILLASYGSGAGSDAFSFVVQDIILEKRNPIPSVRDMIGVRKYIDYSTYVKFRGKIRA